MYIGSLFDPRLKKDYTYSYFMRGTSINYNPDVEKEAVKADYYTMEYGNLFHKKTVSWLDTALLKCGIDLKIDFCDTVFSDYVLIKQGKGSEIGSIDIFTKKEGDLKKIGFYKGETGKNILSEEIRISVREYVDNLVVRFNANCMPVIIEEFDIFGGINLEDSVWPVPEKFNFPGGVYSIDCIKSISYSNEDELFGANYFKEMLKENTGRDIEITKGGGDITLKLLPECDKDRFSLKSENGKCKIEGTGRRGLMYGLSAFLQLIDGKNVKNASLENEDFMQIRGVHFALPNKNAASFIKDMVKYVFIPNHYNMVFIEVAGAMKYDNFPEIHKAWLDVCERHEKGELPPPSHYGFVSRDIWEKSEVKDFVNFISSYGLEVVPEVQTWGHTHYISCAYPDMAEKPSGNVEDLDVDLKKLDDNAIRSEVYFHTLCPNHPDYYNVTFKIIDELLEVFEPKRYVHLGHDEVYNVSECNICKNIPKYKIVAKEITTLYEYVTKKNLKMMIWGDMLQHMEYSTPNAAALIPKDIIMLDFVWYFSMDKDIEDHLLKHGFKVVMGNMYSSHYTRYKTRSKKEGIIGAEVSTWVRGCHEEGYGKEGKIFDFIYSSYGMCNPGYEPEFRHTYYEIIKPVLKDVRFKLAGLNVEGAEKTIAINGEEKNIPFDIRGIVPYNKALCVSYEDCEKKIAVDDYFKVITFAHATDIFAHRIMWKPHFIAGKYILEYEDGSMYEENLTFGAKIYTYLSAFGDIMDSPYFRHQGYIGTYFNIPESGKTYNGENYTIGHYTMKNPYPDKKVKALTIKNTKETGVKILVFDIKIK